MYLFVINKKSGSGNGLRTWIKAQEILQSRQVPYRHIFTENSEQAVGLISDILQEPELWQAVAIIGGDGTIHSILPVLQKTGIPLAVVPAGSGNDTARNFGIPFDTEGALNVMLTGQSQAVDLILTSGVLTLTALAIGFDAQVAENVNQSWYKKWCNMLRAGRVAYIIGIIHTLLTFRPSRVRVTCDNETVTYEDTWMTAISNGASYGGGFKISPQAIPTDGQLDICVVHGCTRMQLLTLFPSVLTGKHVNYPFVTMLRGRTISIHSEHKRLALGDGENMSSRPYDSTVSPSVLQMMIPAI
ncbi:diacylglycerol/lipid kinase family protein [Paenibacillus crassostreae]|uniref:Lipid kinase n=1 Tax=Paenibacillus crassostreae TaxID=1763538 RepID=A0A162RJI5_9BACL|nr:diacylglycerol kinase family protein [Paenibacillus crassostreae]AOZ92439.1 lipid kinase [Paenibacillus crassostreae]OAB72387.1 lipid kinase [Paenibacillus crassostreae]